MIITFPTRAKVNRIVAKENFYGKVDTTTRNLFQDQVARIIWEYKLAPSTINLASKQWPEIEVFRIALKGPELSEKVLEAIDTAIPYPILFIIEYNAMEKAAICYKEPSRRNENITKVDTYFGTDWNDPKLVDMQIDGLDIDTVYSNFLRQVAGNKLVHTGPTNNVSNASSTIKDDVAALKEREKIQKQIDALTRKIKTEPSLGKRQSLAEERYELQRLLK